MAKSENEGLPLRVVLSGIWGLRAIHLGHEICPMISETFFSPETFDVYVSQYFLMT